MVKRPDPALAEQVDRYAAFADKVLARFREVLAEADREIDGVLQVEPLDVTPLAAALNVVKARSEGLVTKIEEAAEQIEQQIDGVDREDEPSINEAQAAEWAIRHRREWAEDEIRIGYLRFEAKKQADAARMLVARVQAETGKPIQCAACGAPFQANPVAQPTNVACPFCRAVNTLRPGMATAAYYSRGVPALVREALDAEWTAMIRWQDRYTRRRHRTEDEFLAYAHAYRTYWHAYHRKLGEMTPSLSPAALAEEVEGKERWLKSEAEMGGMAMSSAIMLNGLRIAAQGNPAALAAWSQQASAALRGFGVDLPGTLLESLAEAAWERGQDQLLDPILQALYKATPQDSSFKSWRNEVVGDLGRRIDRRAG